MTVRLLINEDVVYDGEAIPIPRVGDHLRRDDDVVQVEAVTWAFDDGLVVVALLAGTKSYTF